MVPKWLHIAIDELGVEEVPGKDKNPRIAEYHKAVSDSGADEDTSWCSSFACWCMERAGIVSPRSMLARSWLNWGHPIQEPRIGCKAIIERGGESWMAHVGDAIGWTDDYIYLIGGNQQNMVRVSVYSRDKVIGYRWPEGVA